jgi:hypothetical protein
MSCAPGIIFGGTEGVGSLFHLLLSRTRFRLCLRPQVLFSSFVLPGTFSEVQRASGPVSMVGAPGLVSTVPTASGPVFMFRASVLVFGVTEGDVFRFHLLRSRTYFRRFRGRRVPFSSFALPDSFSKVPSASGPVFMFRAPRLVFGDSEGVGSRFHIFRSRTNFRRYRGRRVLFFPILRVRNLFRWYLGRRVPFSCFALPDSFSALPRASDPFLMFCASGLVFGSAEDVGSRFHVLLSHTRFRRYRGRRLPSSCFARPFSFSAEPWALGPVFMFCAPELVLVGTEGVGSRFHVFAPPNSFSVVPRASGSVFMVGAPGLVSTVPRASGPVFMFRTPGLVFGDTEGVGPVFMFGAPGIIFGGSEGFVSRFHLLHSRTRFRRYRGRRSYFHVLPARTRFRRYRGRRSCFFVLRSRTRFQRCRGR